MNQRRKGYTDRVTTTSTSCLAAYEYARYKRRAITKVRIRTLQNTCRRNCSSVTIGVGRVVILQAVVNRVLIQQGFRFDLDFK